MFTKKLSGKELQKVTGGKKWSTWWCFVTSVTCSNTWDGNSCEAYYRHCL